MILKTYENKISRKGVKANGECKRENCIHRDEYRRVPEIDGGLGLCPKLKECD